MAGDEEGRRTRLMELLTAKSALPPDLTRRPERGAVSFSEAKLPGLETRLLHLQALRRHLADSERLPFHRFWPLRFPFVLDSALLKPNAASSVRRIPEAVDVFRDRLARRKRVALAETFDALSAQSGSSDSACQVQIPVQWAAFLEKQHSLSPAEELRVILIQLVLLGSFVWAPVLLFYVWRRFCTSRRRKVLFLIGLALLFAFPRRPRPGVRLWPGWRQIHKYHRTAAIVEKPEALPPNHPTIFAVVPHGVFPIAPAMMITSDFGHLLGAFRLAAASIVRWCLVYGQLTFLADAIPASRSEMKKCLEQGSSVLVSPGGIAEMYEAGAHQERLYLKERKGLVRLAIQTGAHIVPVYAFGSSQVFRLFWGMRFLQPLARLLRIAVVLMYGRFGLPVSLKRPLLFAVGRPLTFPSNETPTNQEVEAAHALLTSELRRLFETYKGHYGWENKKLQIL